jgi:hypothetical protein
VSPQNHKLPSGWFWRRLLAYAVTAFSMTMLTWLAWNGVQSGELHHLIAEGCFWLLIAVFSVYCGGATMTDIIQLTRAVKGQSEDNR